MNYSPLRYPGGKSKIMPLIKIIMQQMEQPCSTYVEPFAGGAGVALGLLLDGVVERIIINDYDKAIYSFWRSILEQEDEFIRLIEKTPVTIKEWNVQKNIYVNYNNRYSMALGFATFFLNRTNISGILGAGPIGGHEQNGQYAIDARYNKDILIDRIRKIAVRKKDIKVYNKEILAFIDKILPSYNNSTFIYYDPPYLGKGKRLYKNFFTFSDHVLLAQYIKEVQNCEWIITYDNVLELQNLYRPYPQYRYSLNYSAANKGKGNEIIIFKSERLLPFRNMNRDSFASFKLEEI